MSSREDDSLNRGVRHLRLLRAGVTALMISALLAACTDGRAAVEPTPTPAVTVTPTATLTPTPTPTPEVDEEQARLEELRASDAFVEYAEHDRAQTGQWARFAYDEFTLSTDDAGVRAEWTNKAELWDELMPAFRDECLLAGPVATRPIWDGQIMIPVGLAPRWSDASTSGRGQFIDAVCVFLNTEQDEVVERWMGALIRTRSNGSGEVLRKSQFFDVSESSAESREERTEMVRKEFWEWITEEPAP
jgi:hypothetical protein